MPRRHYIADCKKIAIVSNISVPILPACYQLRREPVLLYAASSVSLLLLATSHHEIDAARAYSFLLLATGSSRPNINS